MPESAAKVVPIRFPAQIHEQLKAWCEEHNFPMAAVVRGLVERFLESQEMP
jgi:predicted DNA-binding protein